MGKFIVLYGSNNLGKSTQMDLLEKVWQEMGRSYVRIKYPIYDSPTGEIINQILRDGVEIADEDFQALYAEDRRQYESTLLAMLERGDVLAEDYVGTGLAWGLTKGVDREFLDEANAGLLVPDVAILIDGERFSCGIEKKHRHESAGNEIWERNRRIHQELAAELGWEMVNANERPEKIHERIMEIIGDRV